MKRKNLLKELFTLFASLSMLSGTMAQTAETSADKVYESKQAVDFTIDGNDDDWGTAEYQSLGFYNMGSEVSEDDFNVKFKTAWDETYFYAFVDVSDDAAVLWKDFNDDLSKLWNAYQHDNVEFYFNADFTNDSESGEYGDDAVQIRIVRGTPDQEKLEDGDYELSQQESPGGDGWKFEMKIKWEALPGFGTEGKQVSADDSIGFEVTAADADNADDLRETIITWGNDTGVDEAWKNTKLFGKLKFMEETVEAGSGTSITLQSAKVKVYPTIVSRYLSVEAENLENVKVFDLLGRKLLDVKSSYNQAYINMAPFATGTYVIISYGNNNVLSIDKIIKK